MTKPTHVLARAALLSAALAVGGGTGAAVIVAVAPLAAATAAPSPDGTDGTVLAASQAIEALRRDDIVSFSVLRRQVADDIGPRVGIDPARLAAAWAAAGPQRATTVLSAITQLGVPYHRRAATPGEGFDCSGLTSWAWAQSGVLLPHQSGGQIHAVDRSSFDAVQPGDLIYRPGHVMLALGVGGAMIHAPHRGAAVEVRMLSESQIRRMRVGDPLG